jgi:hypothetical protein
MSAMHVRVPFGHGDMTDDLRSVQDIQLELIRRSSFNSFNGPRVHRDLLARRALWKAVLIDRPRCLIKLRDLADDCWNVDTLFVLARDENSARVLAELEEPWEADWVIVDGQQATKAALGSTVDRAERLVTFWWD